ncbi:Rieske (2Fe-2S) protein [Nocardioides dongxiaopingii]|uniref:Rieske (2Fe-2S) protein n=1 Tax=Nocardioides sp. S-1144 TaxID=2582905 RepID=UPI001C9E57F7|nr:Rieske (2Fe-2S) protein [Nocardioides sp. S-1144]
MSNPAFTRRRALAGASSVGLALPVLSACGDDGGSSSGTMPSDAPSSSSSSAAAPTTPSASSDPAEPSEPTTPEGAAGVVGTADVPVGGGVIIAGSKIVVTQPSAGDIKVFSSICTHQGCPVTQVTDVITCTCHGSTFDLSTGDVLGGPASAPLPAVDFTVDGDQVVLS